MDERLKKLKESDPQKFKRLIVRRDILCALVLGICLPASVGAIWITRRGITAENYLEIFSFSFFVLVVCFGIALKITDWIMVKIYGDIAIVEMDEQDETVRENIFQATNPLKIQEEQSRLTYFYIGFWLLSSAISGLIAHRLEVSERSIEEAGGAMAAVLSLFLLNRRLNLLKCNPKSVSLGFLAALASQLGLAVIGGAAFALTDNQGAHNGAAFMYTVPGKVVGQLIIIGTMMLGGFVAGRIATKDEIKNAGLAGVVMILILAIAGLLLPPEPPGPYDVWFNIAGYGLIIPASVCGGYIGRQMKGRLLV